jgi:hypothetical protein
LPSGTSRVSQAGDGNSGGEWLLGGSAQTGRAVAQSKARAGAASLVKGATMAWNRFWRLRCEVFIYIYIGLALFGLEGPVGCVSRAEVRVAGSPSPVPHQSRSSLYSDRLVEEDYKECRRAAGRVRQATAFQCASPLALSVEQAIGTDLCQNEISWLLSGRRDAGLYVRRDA